MNLKLVDRGIIHLIFSVFAKRRVQLVIFWTIAIQAVVTSGAERRNSSKRRFDVIFGILWFTSIRLMSDITWLELFRDKTVLK
jgi:hypothetical protein